MTGIPYLSKDLFNNKCSTRSKSYFSYTNKRLYNCVALFLGNLTGHENRITSLSVAENGLAVATCSWDQNVRVWG